MRLFGIITLAAGFCALGSASNLTVYTNKITNTAFAGATYYMDVDSAGAITTATFSDGNATTSGTETATTHNTRIPAASVMTLDPRTDLVSAEYTLTYNFDTLPGGSVNSSGLPAPHKSTFAPTFTAENQDLTLDLIFYSKSGIELLDYTTLLTGAPFSMDLAPLIETGDGGTILADYEKNGIVLKSVISDPSGVVFTDTSAYATGLDKNVDITYNVKERLTATSTLSVTTIPEPATYALLALGLLAIATFKRERAA